MAMLARKEAHAAATHIGSLGTCTFSPRKDEKRRVPASLASL